MYAQTLGFTHIGFFLLLVRYQQFCCVLQSLIDDILAKQFYVYRNSVDAYDFVTACQRIEKNKEK